MHRHGPGRSFDPTLPPEGLHLVDVSMFYASSAGARRVLATKHALLPRYGWRHTLVAPGAEGRGMVDCGGLRLPGLKGHRWVARGGPAENLIAQAAPDIVEAADPFALGRAALAASERLGVPSVAFCHHNLPAIAARWAAPRAGTGSASGRWAASLARRYLVNHYAGFDMVLAPSRGLTERLVSWGVRHAVHQPLGVDTEVFTPSAADLAWRHGFLARLGLPSATRLLVCTGRYAPEKNLDVLADAVRLLGPGHTLLAVGAGPQPPRGAQVVLLPHEPDAHRLARLLASADAYLHAGDQEAFSLGVLEAMASGLPVVASVGGGVGELAHGAGITVPRLHAGTWADAINAAIDGEGARHRASALGRARAHDWTRIVEQMSRRYTRLVRRHTRAVHHRPGTGTAEPSRATANEEDPTTHAMLGAGPPAAPALAPKALSSATDGTPALSSVVIRAASGLHAGAGATT